MKEQDERDSLKLSTNGSAKNSRTKDSVITQPTVSKKFKKRKKRRSSRYKSSKNYKYKTWTLDLDPKNLPKSDDISYTFPYSEDLQGFDFSGFDPCRNMDILSGQDMLTIKEELEKLGDLYKMNFGAGALTYSLIAVFGIIGCFGANYWIDNVVQLDAEKTLIFKISIFFVVLILTILVMAVCYRHTETLMKRREGMFRRVEKEWNERESIKSRGIKFEFGFVGNYLKVILDRDEMERREKESCKKTARTRADVSSLSSGKEDPDRDSVFSAVTSNSKSIISGRLTQKLEIIDEENDDGSEFDVKPKPAPFKSESTKNARKGSKSQFFSGSSNYVGRGPVDEEKGGRGMRESNSLHERSDKENMRDRENKNKKRAYKGVFGVEENLRKSGDGLRDDGALSQGGSRFKASRGQLSHNKGKNGMIRIGDGDVGGGDSISSISDHEKEDRMIELTISEIKQLQSSVMTETAQNPKALFGETGGTRRKPERVRGPEETRKAFRFNDTLHSGLSFAENKNLVAAGVDASKTEQGDLTNFRSERKDKEMIRMDLAPSFSEQKAKYESMPNRGRDSEDSRI